MKSVHAMERLVRTEAVAKAVVSVLPAASHLQAYVAQQVELAGETMGLL